MRASCVRPVRRHRRYLEPLTRWRIASAGPAELNRIDDALKQAAHVPRLFLLEMEYVRAAQVTERLWVISVIEGLRSESLTWSEAWLRQVAAQFSDSGANSATADE
jgi:hypothetical protein